MAETSTLHRPRPTTVGPRGDASLRVRERYLRRRSHRRSLGERRLNGLWLLAVAAVSWLFVVGFASFAH